MSLILEGIDLPEKNMKVVCLFPNGAEELVVLDSGATAGRPIHTIQIPKGHGRLIDDRLIPYIDLNEGNNEIKVFATFRENIKRVPTILEAEENE